MDDSEKNRKHSVYHEILKDIESTNSLSSNFQNIELNIELAINEKILKEVFQNCSDIVFRPIQIYGDTKLLLIYIDGLSDTKTLDEVVLKPMLFDELPEGWGKVTTVEQVIERQFVAIAQVKKISSFKDVVNGILKGNIAIIVDEESRALVADLKGFEKRGVEEPAAETTVRGPRDGFTETLRTNTSLVRRRIRSANLKMESITVGQLTQTDVVIAYIDGIVSNTILDEVRKEFQESKLTG